ncbi:MAG: UDP-N-acetylmuramoyl-tripeptide--D-alanyl-D-alanine ligase [Prevotella sp.]|nr:UDP-N-acetylmuramoyl-tripeptide--D-alanyl-D-alanine ligase [Prevotella sp.]
MDIKELYNLYKQHPCITTDSRDCPEGSIFLALKGESFDGNKFAVQALQKGCAYAIVDDEGVAGEAEGTEYRSRLILVGDCLQTFKDLAREHRRQFPISVIGITGTNGKTTTKELVATVLQQKYNVLFTQGNFNNDVGVPKTLFRLNKDHQIAVIEMGASHPGDIRTLVNTAEPTCGLITNVGRAHLQGFGSFEGVKKTKGELYDFLSQADENSVDEGFVFVNTDDEDLMQMVSERNIIFTAGYGTTPTEETSVLGRIVACDPYLRFQWCFYDSEEEEQEWFTVNTHLIGSYNLYNMLAAISVGLYFDVDPEPINRALSDYVPHNNRSQLTETERNHLIVDAYNANPTSMAAALRNFRDMAVSPKMAILGDMRELGDVSAEEHQRAVDLMKEYGLETVWLVGEEFGKTDCSYRKFADVEAVKKAIAQERPAGFYILVKGSNSMLLWQLPELL